jgi:hypothetical protein
MQRDRCDHVNVDTSKYSKAHELTLGSALSAQDMLQPNALEHHNCSIVAPLSHTQEGYCRSWLLGRRAIPKPLRNSHRYHSI